MMKTEYGILLARSISDSIVCDASTVLVRSQEKMVSGLGPVSAAKHARTYFVY